MIVPPASHRKLVIVDATGMVGGYALRYALGNPAVGAVTSIGRRKLGISHPKLKEIQHQDFADCSSLADVLANQDAAVFCLGTYTGAVPEAKFRKVMGYRDWHKNWKSATHHGLRTWHTARDDDEPGQRPDPSPHFAGYYQIAFKES